MAIGVGFIHLPHLALIVVNQNAGTKEAIFRSMPLPCIELKAGLWFIYLTLAWESQARTGSHAIKVTQLATPN